ncbi:MAG: NAD-dependent epimerase/dehydratase family protein [Actinomycetota bacterium]
MKGRAGRAVVTGGAGFIGSHLVDRLTGEGAEVLVIDNLASGAQRLPFLEAAGAKHECLDIRQSRTTELIESFAPEQVFHLAAQMDVRRSVADPIFDAEVNVIGTLRVLEGARRAGARVISASSGGCIYGEVDPGDLPADERTPKNPDSPYGITKSVMQDYLRFYHHTYGIPYVNLALSNVFGPRQDPSGEAGVVAIFGKRLLEGRPCTIFGDGEQTRDFCFAGDVATAFMAARRAGDGLTINIGTGVQTSVNRLYRAIADLCGVPADAGYAPARAGELQRSCLDSSLAGQVLGWSPQVLLEEGLAQTLEFLKEV